MKYCEARKMFIEEMKRHAMTKNHCDECIPDEVIELDRIIYKLLLDKPQFDEAVSLNKAHYNEIIRH